MKKSIFISFLGIIIYACQNQQQMEFTKYYNNGKDIYQAKCKNCHGSNGEGFAKLSPPLTDTSFLIKNKSRLASIIKHGANEPMTINGKIYHEPMPAFKDLQTIDIAQVIVYITNSFENHQGFYSYEQVALDLENSKK